MREFVGIVVECISVLIVGSVLIFGGAQLVVSATPTQAQQPAVTGLPQPVVEQPVDETLIIQEIKERAEANVREHRIHDEFGRRHAEVDIPTLLRAITLREDIIKAWARQYGGLKK